MIASFDAIVNDFLRAKARLSNASRERKNETGAGVAQARPVIRPVFPPRRKC